MLVYIYLLIIMAVFAAGALYGETKCKGQCLRELQNAKRERDPHETMYNIGEKGPGPVGETEHPDNQESLT